MPAEIETARLTLRLAHPAMAPAMARFMVENFPGHLDRWSPPPAAAICGASALAARTAPIRSTSKLAFQSASSPPSASAVAWRRSSARRWLPALRKFGQPMWMRS